MPLPKDVDTKALFVLLLLIGIAGVFFYWRTGVEDTAGDYHVKKGNYRLEDGQFDKAVEEFRLALEKNPDHSLAHLGLGITFMQMARNDEALAEFDRALALDPKLAAAHADKGILLDRLGRYEEALVSYKKSLALDSTVAEGPGWIWRFLRNIEEKPPTIRDRAVYLEAELKKPPEERLLRVPEEDAKQRMYRAE